MGEMRIETETKRYRNETLVKMGRFAKESIDESEVTRLLDS